MMRDNRQRDQLPCFSYPVHITHNYKLNTWVQHGLKRKAPTNEPDTALGALQILFNTEKKALLFLCLEKLCISFFTASNWHNQDLKLGFTWF